MKVQVTYLHIHSRNAGPFHIGVIEMKPSFIQIPEVILKNLQARFTSPDAKNGINKSHRLIQWHFCSEN